MPTGPRLATRAGCALVLCLTLVGCGGDTALGPADVTGGVADVSAPADGARDSAGDTHMVQDARAEETLGGDPSDGAGEVGPSGPDASFVHVVPAEAVVSAAAGYEMDEATLYRTTTQLPDLDVRAIAVVESWPDDLWVGTSSGLLRYVVGEDRFEAIEEAAEPVIDIGTRLPATGRLAVLRKDSLLFWEDQPVGAYAMPLAEAVWTSLAVDPTGDVWLGGSLGLWLDGNLAPATEQAQEPVLDVAAADDGGIYVLTGAGVWRIGQGTQWEGQGRAIAAAPGGGALWIATPSGATRLDVASGEAMDLEAAPGALAYDDSLSVGVSGHRVVIGHAIGATALELGPDRSVERSDYYTRSTRWFAGESASVQAIAVHPFNPDTYWLGTATGLTRIDWVDRTLTDMADLHEEDLADHFWRLDGFVGSNAGLDDAWEPTSWHVTDFDNDGLWTQMQVGAWCYAFAATGEEIYYQRARQAMDQMFLLVDLPASDFEAAGLGRGFVARSFVRDDEGSVYDSKLTQSNWHPVQWEGHEYRWKDDTSSDELAGHFFGYPLFYDLCARSDHEREAVAEHAAAIARYVVEGGYTLRDLDGEPTTHGHWNPERLAVAADGFDECTAPLEICGEAYFGGGWLNSLEIMGHLLATWHMTGDPYFYAAYDTLVTEHQYDVVAMPHEQTVTITSPQFMNHSDHELAMLAYHTLIRYEPDDARRQLWIESLLFMHEHELVERNPLWAAFVSLAAGADPAELEPAIQSLREMPPDRRNHPVDNSHRKDATPWPDDRFDDPQFQEVFPYDEIRTVWWNGNLHVADHGGNIQSVSGPMAWLLPYWALRYGGAISE